MFRLFLAVLLLLVAAPAVAQTSSTDAVHAGYMRLYAGERDAAFKHFEALRASNPASLAPWFGQLFAHETRIEFDVKIAESPELYTLAVQRHGPGALTPHEARQRAEATVDRAQTLANLWAAKPRFQSAAAVLRAILDGEEPR